MVCFSAANWTVLTFEDLTDFPGVSTQYVSRVHCSIFLDEDRNQFMLENHGRHGTYVDKKKLKEVRLIWKVSCLFGFLHRAPLLLLQNISKIVVYNSITSCFQQPFVI